MLGAEVAERSPLDVAQMGNGDYHFVIRVKIFCAQVAGELVDLRAAFIAVFVADFNQLILHHFAAGLVVGENLVEECYLAHQLVIFFVKLLD